jgi:protocatechuate 3,4-dioxygenase beta subunit
MATTLSTLFPVTRRGFFLSGAAALISARALADTPTCALTAEQEVGPYYIDYERVRPDVTEGKPGVPLKLRIALADSKSCAPLPAAGVDIWHCDASGVYSGFAANGGDGRGPGRGGPGSPGGPGRFGPDMQGFVPGMPPPGRGPDGRGGPDGGPPPARITDAARFLRGVQVTDKRGFVDFTTLYPGWYQGRAIHIHLKVHLGGSATDGAYAGGHVSHTGQLFFPEDITQDIAKLEPYAKRLGVYRTTQAEDGVFNGQHGAACMLGITRLKSGSNADGFLATVTLAIALEATPAPVGAGGRGPRGGRG